MKLNQEVDANFTYFESILHTLIAKHAGEYAVIRDQKIVAFYASVTEAYDAASADYPDARFSIQKVANEPVDLGFFSYADDHR